jgi:hypothetical protein
VFQRTDVLTDPMYQRRPICIWSTVVCDEDRRHSGFAGCGKSGGWAVEEEVVMEPIGDRRTRRGTAPTASFGTGS